MKMKKLVLAIALGALSSGAMAQELPPLPVDKGVRIGKLDNGLTYYIRHNAYPEHQADFYIAQKVGSIQEEDNQCGLAHFLEHMCFNGTKHFPGNNLISYLETIGVKFGQNLNAYTSVDETVYNITNVPTMRQGAVDSCLLVLSDWAGALTLDKKEIDKERGVIHEEWRVRTGAQMRIIEKILPKLYPGSKYANRLPIGKMSIVDNFPAKDLRKYYQKWYRPDLQGIVVVGDVDVDHIEAKIKELFGGYKVAKNAAERVYFPVADNDDMIVASGQDKEQTNIVACVMFKHSVTPDSAKNNVAYIIERYYQSIISSMMSSRFQEMSQNPDVPFVYAGLSNGGFLLSNRTKEAVEINAVAKDGKLEDCYKTIYREVLRMWKHGFNAAEYDRARKDYLGGLERSYANRNKQENNSYTGAYIRNFLSCEPILSIEDRYSLLTNIAPQIPVEAINEYCKMLFNPTADKNMVVMSLLPEKEGVNYPDDESLKETLKSVRNEDLTAWVDNSKNEPLISQMPVEGKIVKEEKADYDFKVWTLSNGCKVYVRKTDFKDNEVRFAAVSHGGESMYDTNEINTINLFDQGINASGLGNFSNLELQKALSGKQVNVGVNMSTNKESISGTSTPKDLETMFQMTYLYFTNVKADPVNYASEMSTLHTVIANRAANPMTAFNDSITKTLYDNNPRIQNLTAEMIKKADYNRMLEIHKERFANAADFHFVVIGNFEEDSLKSYVQKYIASLPASKDREKAIDRKLYTHKGVRSNIFKRKMEIPQATTALVWMAPCEYNTRNRLLANIAGQILSKRCLDEIREKNGKSYSPSAASGVSFDFKPEARIQIFTASNPDGYEETVNQLKEILKGMTEKVDQIELDKVKEFLIKDNKQSLKNNNYWLSLMTEKLLYGFDVRTDFDKVIKSITTDDIKKFTKSVIDANNMIEVVMIPE